MTQPTSSVESYLPEIQPIVKQAQEELASKVREAMLTKQGSSVDLDYTPKCDEVEIPSSNLPVDMTNVIQKSVTESLQTLMRNILSLIDASIPNKDQNRALKKFIEKEFDSAFLEILKDMDYENSGEYVAASLLGDTVRVGAQFNP
jgi:hypothetical protein